MLGGGGRGGKRFVDVEGLGGWVFFVGLGGEGVEVLGGSLAVVFDPAMPLGKIQKGRIALHLHLVTKLIFLQASFTFI